MSEDWTQKRYAQTNKLKSCPDLKSKDNLFLMKKFNPKSICTRKPRERIGTQEQDFVEENTKKYPELEKMVHGIK